MEFNKIFLSCQTVPILMEKLYEDEKHFNSLDVHRYFVKFCTRFASPCFRKDENFVEYFKIDRSNGTEKLVKVNTRWGVKFIYTFSY